MIKDKYFEYCKGCGSFECIKNQEDEDNDGIHDSFILTFVDDCGMWAMVTNGIVEICPCADCLVKGVCTTLCDKVREVWDKYDGNCDEEN